jgi:hypothetical protein
MITTTPNEVPVQKYSKIILLLFSATCFGYIRGGRGGAIQHIYIYTYLEEGSEAFIAFITIQKYIKHILL